MENQSDAELIVAYLQGDEKSLEILIQRYLKPIYSFVYRSVGDAVAAEDITQETCLRAWRNLKKFDQEKSFKTWIFSIAKNASFDFLKKKKAIPFSKFEDEEGLNSFADTIADLAELPSTIFEKADIGRKLAGVLEQLSPNYRMVLFLHYNDHFNFREIAESLGEPFDTVKSRHRRALIILKKLLMDSPEFYA